MIIIYHSNNKVVSIKKEGKDVPKISQNISKQLKNLAVRYPNELLVWCNKTLNSSLNFTELDNLKFAKNTFYSYRTSNTPYLTEAIGYITKTPFVNVNKKVIYPTWLMSSDVGCIHASVFSILKDKLKDKLNYDKNFDYFLNSFARLSMPIGLFCYSNPRLLNKFNKIEGNNINTYFLFKFVKQHYKGIWSLLLFINLYLYQGKFSFLPFLFSLIYKRRKLISDEKINFTSEKSMNNVSGFDVIIPTIGRKKYLYNTLRDLAKQSLLPKNIIIVEQNPNLNSKSELDYLNIEEWPFNIKHHFINNTGACNARNIALKEVKSDWVFFADDDIVLNSEFLKKSKGIIENSNHKAFTFNCYIKNEVSTFKIIKQWESFGAGCSIVNMKAIKGQTFSMAFEHGFGEDSDFGMQLRNKGIDIVYIPEPSILHLKAPMGGFREKPQMAWVNEKIKPKPYPTVTLYFKKHYSVNQLLGYKTTLFLKYYKLQNIRNPFKYYKIFTKQWEKSIFWANKLQETYY